MRLRRARAIIPDAMCRMWFHAMVADELLAHLWPSTSRLESYTVVRGDVIGFLPCHAARLIGADAVPMDVGALGALYRVNIS